MKRTLVIGFGNLDRADDGVAFHIINAFRREMGQEPLPENETGLDALGSSVDSVFIGQLVPEMIELLAGYDRVVFIDAHVEPTLDELHCGVVLPDDAGLTFTHHISPATLLAFFEALYGRHPDGYLVSVHGHDFDFQRDLSPATAVLVAPAVERIMSLVSFHKEAY